MTSIVRWVMSWSIRWKLQVAFFMVTMITIIFNRWLAVSELNYFIQIVNDSGASATLIQQLEDNRSSYIFDSFWESAIEMVILFGLISVLSVFLVRPIKILCSALEAMEKGDLTREVKVTNLDEIGELERHFNGMLVKLNNLMHSVNDSSMSIGQSAYQIATISHDISEVSKTERDSSSDVSSATTQLQTISERVQQLTTAAGARAEETEKHAANGISALQVNISQMGQTAQQINRAADEISELEKAAQEIHSFVSAITGIADQTNLLALNAAIEAARAGEQGRGFAVVADEVRNLARGTNDSAAQISEIVGTLSTQVQQVATTMQQVVEQVNENQQKTNETSLVIERISNDVTETAAANREIAEASEQQLGQLTFLREKMEWLFATLDKSSTKVETTESIGNALYELTEKLNTLMAGFQFERAKTISRTENEKRQHPRVQNHLLVHIEQDGLSFDGMSKDFSLSGIKLKLSKEIREAYPIKLDIRIPYSDITQYENQTPFTVSGRIVWTGEKKGYHYYGIKFDPLSVQQEITFKKAFEFFSINAEY